METLRDKWRYIETVRNLLKQMEIRGEVKRQKVVCGWGFAVGVSSVFHIFTFSVFLLRLLEVRS
ncbi:hypothetical protein DMA11_22370 [Marinilabiliaceae bacterium JC017]|nr:hypothetical protein DMA11_22370 [Marinilabiliaceae bacterium JC017]